MELTRDQVFVNQYHYDARNLEWEKQHGKPETNVEVTFQLVSKDEEKTETHLVAVLQFQIVRQDFVIAGVISQLVHLKNRIIDEPKEFSQEEVQSLADPLLEVLQRMTYEVSEIALDRPGVHLEF
ncbi:DUF1149 family protein [Streptococcus dentapri]|uniref:DUF1149 family protein n=1 Tax=Streptococcus dentapri TaxID=573564 RepID=A0ABV8D0Q5_9STRE